MCKSDSRLRGEVGVGVFPQDTPPEWIDFPPPAVFGAQMRAELVGLPRKRERRGALLAMTSTAIHLRIASR